MTNQPEWVAPYAAATKKLRVNNRDLTAAHCPTCNAQVLTGMSDDRLAHMATIDPTPVSPIGEALAHLEGRRTYVLRRHGERYRLAFTRDRWHIRGEPVGEARRPDYDVVADHACGQPLPATASVHRPVRVADVGADDPPPF